LGEAELAATTHADRFEDLAPSIHVHKGWGERISIKYYPNRPNKVCSVTRNLHIEEGTIEDYRRLAEFHYRNPETHPIPIKIFSLKSEDGECVGVILYSYPPPNIFGRRKAIGRRVSIEELNRDWATISRVIIHPKYRSVGLGSRLVRETLPLVGRKYVETMAVMARYNPFFEKAGMIRIAERRPPEKVMKTLRVLEDLGFKRYLLTSVEYNLERLKNLTDEEIRRVRDALTATGQYKRLMTTRKAYPRKEEFRRWIEDQSLEAIAKVLCRLAVLAETKVYLFWKREAST